ncbi:hypothetical protein Tco_0314608, partial [Tanacetum coccineum]
MIVTSSKLMLLFSGGSSCTFVKVRTISFSSSSVTMGASVLAISSSEYSTWHSRFEPFVSRVVVIGVAVVVIVVVIVVVVVVESLIGLAKVR